MKLNTKARLISIVLLGLLAAVELYLHQWHQFAAGRDAFLAAQSAHYDRIVELHKSFGTKVIAALLSVGVGVGLYELIVFIASKIIAWIGDEQSADGS